MEKINPEWIFRRTGHPAEPWDQTGAGRAARSRGMTACRVQRGTHDSKRRRSSRAADVFAFGPCFPTGFPLPAGAVPGGGVFRKKPPGAPSQRRGPGGWAAVGRWLGSRTQGCGKATKRLLQERDRENRAADRLNAPPSAPAPYCPRRICSIAEPAD